MNLTPVKNKIIEEYDQSNNGSISNRPVNMALYDLEQLTKTPEMTGKNGSKALYEIHIFLAQHGLKIKKVIVHLH